MLGEKGPDEGSDEGSDYILLLTCESKSCRKLATVGGAIEQELRDALRTCAVSREFATHAMLKLRQRLTIKWGQSPPDRPLRSVPTGESSLSG